MPIFRGQPRLLQRFREGERGALEVVYGAYVDKVTNIARFGFRSAQSGLAVPGLAQRPDEVADLVQEVFLKAFAPKARRSFDGDRTYGPYLYAIARNVAIDWARRRGRELPTPWSDLAESAADLEPEEAGDAPWADEATMALVVRYLASLDDELKSVHSARYEEGLSQREAAERLKIGRQVLRTREARLREGLRRELAKLEPG
jgi:RNA polymerase sigma-70 factor (ECF subfamily)